MKGRIKPEKTQRRSDVWPGRPWNTGPPLPRDRVIEPFS